MCDQRLEPSSKLRRVAVIATGHTAKKVEEYFFDWLLYATVVYFCTDAWGPIWGALYAFCIMAVVSAWWCEQWILFYDRMGIDWLGFEALKEVREVGSSGGWFARTIAKIVQKGDVAAFFALSLYGDPFMVTVYFRRRDKAYDGLQVRDWVMFLAAVLVSNAYWTLRWSVIIELARYFWIAIQTYWN